MRRVPPPRDPIPGRIVRVEFGVGATRDLDGHRWTYLGRERIDDPDLAAWAREVWQCDYCLRVSKVFDNPPKVWTVGPVRIYDGGFRYVDGHIAIRCDRAGFVARMKRRFRR